MRPPSINFILDEITPHLARRRCGCRIVERIIEHFPPQLLATFVDELLCDVDRLCKHVYGNLVVQSLLEHGDQARRRRIVQVLSYDLKSVALHEYASNVLGKVLSYVSVEDQHWLAELVLQENGLLPEMVLLRHGFAATMRLMRVIRDDEQLLAIAKSQLSPDYTVPNRKYLGGRTRRKNGL